MPRFGDFAPVDHVDTINHQAIPGSAPTNSEADLVSIVKHLEMIRNYDNFSVDAAKLDPHAGQKWRDIKCFIDELDKCNEIQHAFLAGVNEIVAKYRMDEPTADNAVLEDLTKVIGMPANIMTKMFDALMRESNRLMGEKLHCERRLLEFENTLKSVKSCMDAARAQLSSEMADEDGEPLNTKKYIEASAEMTTEMARIAEKRMKKEAHRLFEINHRLMMIQYWTKVNHIRQGDTCICSICYTTNVNAFFQDCGHTGCYDCLTKLDKCHWCRGPARLKRMFFNGPVDPNATVGAPPAVDAHNPMRNIRDARHDMQQFGRIEEIVWEAPAFDGGHIEDILWEPPVAAVPAPQQHTAWDYVTQAAHYINRFIRWTTTAL